MLIYKIILSDIKLLDSGFTGAYTLYGQRSSQTVFPSLLLYNMTLCLFKMVVPCNCWRKGALAIFTLLLVDDEPSILHGLAKMIKRETQLEINVILADNAAQALDLCSMYNPDLLITDIYMPEMDGFELIEAVASRFTCKRFVILSGYNDFELARKALHEKTLEYLTKPVNKKELLLLLDHIAHDVKEEKQFQKRQFDRELRNCLLFNLEPATISAQTTVTAKWQSYPNAYVLIAESSQHEAMLSYIVKPATKLFDDFHILKDKKHHRLIVLGVSNRPFEQTEILNVILQKRTETMKFSIGLALCQNKWENLHACYQQSCENVSYDAYFSGVGTLNARLSSPVETAKAYIHTHYQEDISLNTLAEITRLHPNYFSSMFKKKMGLSFSQYFNQYRILKAKEIILKHPESTFETLASEVGFQNPRQFYKIFKECAGVTPGQYRNENIQHQGGKEST